MPSFPVEGSPHASVKLTPTIFHEPWWLSMVSRGKYHEARVYSAGKIVGRLPYVTARYCGMKVVQMPMLTHFLGQCVDAGEGHGPSRLLKELSLTKALIGQLPRASHVYIKHHRETTNTIAFQALGFQTEVQFTAEIAPAAEDLLWLGMRDKTRNVIRRAQERFELLENLQPAAFTALYDEHLTEKRRSNYYDPRICTAVIAECVRRGAGRVLAARDADGSVKAAIFTVWDETAEYYLM